MSRIRLYIDTPLATGASVQAEAAQAHYLRDVMRCREGTAVALFNGRDGEFRAILTAIGKKSAAFEVGECLRAHRATPDGWLVFAPIKHGRIDYLAEKATELGVSALLPVITQFTSVSRVNTGRLRANAVEAAEQSGRLDVPEIHEPEKFDNLLGGWPQDRLLFYCDETGGGASIKELLPQIEAKRWAVIIGPEGGFSPREHGLLRAQSYVRGLGLGPRVLRADTAALAALANLQAWLGDWEGRPDFKRDSE